MTPARILERAMRSALGARQGLTMMSDDEFLDYLRSECAKAIADWLKTINVQRPIVSLTRHEMQGMAEAASGRWIQLVSERIAEVGRAQADKSHLTLLGI